ncbi:hypothetical protein DL96DRAFT_1562610 [Flagelloscypha sp. PMI_526]|nr:hypothetical protein DL96DRAFT_1562610 [Flagelloscypha sp. PMI_526]
MKKFKRVVSSLTKTCLFLFLLASSMGLRNSNARFLNIDHKESSDLTRASLPLVFSSVLSQVFMNSRLIFFRESSLVASSSLTQAVPLTLVLSNTSTLAQTFKSDLDLSLSPFIRSVIWKLQLSSPRSTTTVRSLLHSRTVRKGSTSASLVMNSPFWVIVYEDFGDVRVLLQALQNEEMEEPQMPSPLPVVEAPPEPSPAQELIPPLRLTRSPSFTNVLSYVLLVGATLAVNKFVLP